MKEDYARIARLNLGIIRHIGKRLPTGFQREFDTDFNNAAILCLAYNDQEAFQRYTAALGWMAATRWGVDRVGGYDYNCDGGTITELLFSYELMRDRLPADLRKRTEDWLFEWARVRADESIMKRPDWGWDQRRNQQNYGGALAAVARVLAASRDGKYDVAPLLAWVNGEGTYMKAGRPVTLKNAVGWDVKSRPADEAITQYTNWDAINLWEISRAKGIDPSKFENTKRYFDFILLLTAPNGARARFGHDYQRDSVWLNAADPLHVDSVFINTPDLNAAGGAVRFQATVANRSAHRRSAKLVHIVYDAEQREVVRAETPVQLEPGGTRDVIVTSPPVTQPRRWSPASPNLYTVASQLVVGADIIDEVRNPLGFRWYRFDPDKGFFLNGERLKLRGANIHQGYPYAGNAVPNSKMAFDLHVLKAMGVNFLRTTHITMDPVVLEMPGELRVTARVGRLKPAEIVIRTTDRLSSVEH